MEHQANINGYNYAASGFDAMEGTYLSSVTDSTFIRQIADGWRLSPGSKLTFISADPATRLQNLASSTPDSGCGPHFWTGWTCSDAGDANAQNGPHQTVQGEPRRTARKPVSKNHA